MGLMPAKPLIQKCYHDAAKELPNESVVKVMGTINAEGQLQRVTVQSSTPEPNFVACVENAVASIAPARLKLNKEVAIDASFRVSR